MRRLAATLAVVGALLFSAGSAWADWDDGDAAYDRGDYATAFREATRSHLSFSCSTPPKYPCRPEAPYAKIKIGKGHKVIVAIRDQ